MPAYVQLDRESAAFPQELRWVSKRLTREIVNLDEATRARQMTSYTMKPPFAEATVERRRPETIEDYAVRATEIVRPETGNLCLPNRYLRMVLDFHRATFDVPFIWDDPGQHPIATLFAHQYVHDVGRVYVGLFGSTHNILSDMREESYRGGRTPSDVDGLYRILDESREPEDAGVKPSRLAVEAERSDAELVDSAALILRGVTFPLPLRTYDVLAKPHYLVRDHTLLNDAGRPEHYDLIVIGTAVWAGVPAADPDAVLSGLIDPVRLQFWPIFDELNDDFARRVRVGENPTLPEEVRDDDPARWKAFAAWFVHLGRHLGRRPMQLLACVAPGRLDLSRYFDRRWRDGYGLQPIGVEGFVLSVGDGASVLVTEFGDAVPVRLRGGEPVYSPGTDRRWLESGESPINVSQETLFAVRAAMWGQAARWRRGSHLDA